MAIKHNGKSPGKFWYMRQYAAGIRKTFKEYSLRNRARAMRNDGVISAVGLTAGAVIASTPALATIPFLVTLGPFIAGGAGVIFGIKAYTGYRALKKTSTVYNHVRDAEKAWVEKKMRPPLLKRIGNWLAKPFKRKTPAAPAKDKTVKDKPARKGLFSFFNRKAAAAAPLAAPTPAQAQVQVQVQAPAPAPAVKPPAEPSAADAARAAAAAARAAERARNKRTAKPRF